MKKISVVTPCYNEELNVEALYLKVKEIFGALGAYSYEHIFIDNASMDCTRSILRRLAENDKNVKVIFNTRNFGHIRSPFYGLMQAGGDAVILLVSDFQDPPELIRDFIAKWEAGYKVVLGIKTVMALSLAMVQVCFLRVCLSRLLRAQELHCQRR